MSSQPRPPRIVLIEDNADDVAFFKNALEQASFAAHVEVYDDGERALEFLRGPARRSLNERPDIIVLDLNLPRKDGYEVLAAIKNDFSLRQIPVVVLSTSASPADITRAYDAHANAYIAKPPDYKRFRDVIDAIELFWFTIATLPRKETSA